MFSVNPAMILGVRGENCEALWAEESHAGMLVIIWTLARERLYRDPPAPGWASTVMKAPRRGETWLEGGFPWRALR